MPAGRCNSCGRRTRGGAGSSGGCGTVFGSIRRLAVVGAAVAGLAFGLVLTQPASATPPKAATGSLDLPGVDTAGSDGFCPFGVTVSYINDERTTEQMLPDGTTI